MMPERGKYYTYADYETWDEDFSCELIDGIVYDMSAPSQVHQEVSVDLVTQLRTFLRGKACKVFHAPYNVRLNADTKDDIVVQPDILVVCDKKKLKNGKHCIGAPDFIIEIISPSSRQKDRVLKCNRYREAGVKEYWMVYPEERGIDTLVLFEGNYIYRTYCDEDKIPVSVLEGCVIDMKTVFPEEPGEENI